MDLSSVPLLISIDSPDSGVTQRSIPYTAWEILQARGKADLRGALSAYVAENQDEIRAAGYLVECTEITLQGMETLRMEYAVGAPWLSGVLFYLDGRLSGKSGRVTKHVNITFIAKYLLDMRQCARQCLGPSISIVSSVLERDSRLYNQYLLPVMYTEDYPAAAQRMLETYYPEVLEQPSPVDGYLLAERMGVKVIPVRFPAERTIMGQIFFTPCSITLMQNGASRQVSLDAGTALINMSVCKTKADINTTIVHECCHLYLNRSFFLLQTMAEQPACWSVTRDRAQRQRQAYRRTLSPIDWMELQAEKLPAYVLLPEQTVRGVIEKKLQRDCSPENIRWIVLELARSFHVSRSMAKYRMIELGYPEARGVMNYVNNQFIRDHGCGQPWPQGKCYTISLRDASALYGANSRFRAVVGSGKYLYVEGHFCRDDPRYIVRYARALPKLTAYALRHVDECCLSFTARGRGAHTTYARGHAARKKTIPVTDCYHSRYDFDAEPDTEAFTRQIDAFARDAELWGKIEENFPGTFPEGLRMVMEAKKITQSELALRLGVDRKIVSRMLNGDRPSVSHVTGACIALDLPYTISARLLERAGWILQNTPLHNQYKFMLLNAATLTVEMCNDILRFRGLPPLFQATA